MNLEHLRTYIWVRWRLSANQVRRSGTMGVIISALLTGLRALGGVLTFITGLLVGVLALGHAEPRVVMVIWDGVTVGFLFFWLIGLMSELQRSELLSLDNFMHLPVSPAGAFMINYVGSSVGLSLILFLPAMLGLAVGLTLSHGLAMLPLFPLVAAFFLMVTALTYQFRGWLAGMMANPRRRHTIIAVVTLLFILAVQIPNIMNTLAPGARARRQAGREAAQAYTALQRGLAEGRITQDEFARQASARRAAFEADRRRESERNDEILRLANMAAPPGWLPYGAVAALQGRSLQVLGCMLGMGLIGIASLRRSYRTSIRTYLGDFRKGGAGRKTKGVSAGGSVAPGRSGAAAAFLEKKLPWVSGTASTVALAGFRSLMRAPEVKMMLLTPVIMLIFFGGTLAGKQGDLSGLLQPLIASGATAFILIIGMVGFVGNQFGFDRNGFRAFVLCGAPRRDILLGKNIALLPPAMVMMAFILGISQWMNPMRPDHLAAVMIQTIPTYLLFCLMGNLLSIFSPIALKPGSGMPAPHQGKATLFQILFMIVAPVPVAFVLLPLGVEALFHWMRWAAGFPFFLLLSLIQTLLVLRFYRAALSWQGKLLQQREKKILEVVSSRGE